MFFKNGQITVYVYPYIRIPVYHIYNIYIYIYIYIYSIHILYIFYAKDCVVERDAAAGQPPGQSSHPAAWVKHN